MLYGPRSITVAATLRPSWVKVTWVPQGSFLWAVPIVVGASFSPQAVELPQKPGPYQVAFL